MKKIYRPTWIEINLDNLYHNYQYFQKLNNNKTIIPVIKANAYGHGAIEVMQYLYQKNVKMFAVSLLEEALELREINRNIDILMLGPILNNQLDIASKNKIEVTIYDENILNDVLSFSDELVVHLKVDTGMSRYGIHDVDLIKDSINQLVNKKNIQLKGLFTHFATANDNQDYYDFQLDKFKNIFNQISFKPNMIHISNSSSAFKYENNYQFTTHIRLGISLYGLTLDSNLNQLKDVMSLKSKVVQIKDVKKGECVGYGASYQAKEDEKIAIIPIGYADGFIRKNKNGYVEINHLKYKIVGIICMDALFIKVDDDVKVGDIVTLFGGMIKIDEVAKRLNTINYEVITNMSHRVPRIYIKEK
jgi:alanine racemase